VGNARGAGRECAGVCEALLLNQHVHLCGCLFSCCGSNATVHVVQGVSSPLPDTASILGWNSGQANANGVAAGGLMRAFVNLVCGHAI
jgi:hypothetical protein